ncbi:MAG TPA: ATP-binding cassette domain-containing protein, partial [Candidatus Dojkabacteria bacterium]|nr:ATP-binding cassette domain-containing protein [Candidatus Dojkabacteria bacterium]
MNKTQGPRKRGETILRGENICKTFQVGNNQVEVLKGVNIEIKKQEFIILFGSSGCGKSTLLNV